MGFAAGAAVVAFSTLALVLFDGNEAQRKSVGRKSETLRIRVPAESPGPAKTERKIAERTDKVRLPPTTVKTRGTDVAADQETEKDDQKLLDEVTRGLIAEIEDAMKRRNAQSFLALAEKLRKLGYGSMDGGGSAVSSVKHRILTAAAEIGPEAVAAVLDLLGDPDPTIAAEAQKDLFEILQDVSIGDFQRAEIITAAAEELTDSYALTRLLQQCVNRLRNSVKVATVRQIEATGTTEAKARLPWVISAMTGESTTTQTSQLDSWLEENPDQNVWLYEGSKIQKKINAR